MKLQPVSPIYFLALAVMLASVTGPGCSPETDRGEELLELYRSVEVTPELSMIIEEDEEIIFGQLGSLASDSSGHFFVGDNQLIHIKHFDRDGNLLETIGREGRGPGEFSRVTNMFVARDTLYAYDFDNARLGRFVRNESGDGMRFDHYLDIEMTDERIPRGVLKSQNHYVVESIDLQAYTGQIALLDREGNVLEPDLLTLPLPERVNVMYQGNSFPWTRPLPRRSHYRLTPDDHFYYGWNDSLVITKYDIRGEPINTIRFDVVPPRVTREDTRDLAERMPEEIWNTLRSHVPETRPAFTNFVVDENERVWVNLGNIEEDTDEDRWIILDQDSELVASFRLYPNMFVHYVRDGMLHGIKTGEDELRRVALYDARI